MVVFIFFIYTSRYVFLFPLKFSFFFWPHPMAYRILVPCPGIKPSPTAVEVLSLNHWTPGEVLEWLFLNTSNRFHCRVGQQSFSFSYQKFSLSFIFISLYQLVEAMFPGSHSRRSQDALLVTLLTQSLLGPLALSSHWFSCLCVGVASPARRAAQC